jgi:PAS domain-containing protein
VNSDSSRDSAFLAAELARAEALLAEREQLREDLASVIIQLKTIFGVIPAAVRVFDADGTILRFNVEAVRRTETGFAAGGHPHSLLELLELERPCSLEGNRYTLETHAASRALRGDRVRGELVRIIRGQEEVIVEVSANPLRDETGTIRGAVTVERDVTGRERDLDPARRASSDS